MPGLAAVPATVQLHAFTGDERLEVQIFQLHRQFRTGDLTVAELQAAIDLRCQQPTGNRAAAIQAPGQFLDHRHERSRHRQVQPAQAERAAQRFVLRQRIELRLHHQFAEFATDEVELGVDALGREFAGEFQGLVREVQPLVLVLDAQRAAAGIDADLAVRATGRQVQLQLGVEPALPGEILRQPLREAVDRELLEVITQLRLGHQARVFTAEAGLAGGPAMGAKGDFAVRQAFEFRRPLQLPVLATGLDITAGQASAPIAFVQRTVQTQRQFQLRPLQIEVQLLVLDIALAAGGQGSQ
ncbi:hypothetical protein D9M71_408980 [compost metagenome]